MTRISQNLIWNGGRAARWVSVNEFHADAGERAPKRVLMLAEAGYSLSGTRVWQPRTVESDAAAVDRVLWIVTPGIGPTAFGLLAQPEKVVWDGSRRTCDMWPV